VIEQIYGSLSNS